MITLYQFEISPFCDKVRRILNYKQIKHRIEEISLMKFLGIKKKYPVGKLPFIEHEGKLIGDSTDIAYYLEELSPDKPLIPANSKDKAMVHMFEDWADESLYFYEMRLRFGLKSNQKRTALKLAHADSGLMRMLAPMILWSSSKKVLGHQGIGRRPDNLVLDDVNRHVEALGACLEDREWLVGSELTLADIAVYVQIFCIKDSNEGNEIISKSEIVLNWMARVEKATN